MEHDMINGVEQLSKMASTDPHSLSCSISNEDPHLSSSSHPHDEPTEEEESCPQFLQESHAEEEHPSSQRRGRDRIRRRRRPSCSHFNYRRNPLSLPHSVYLIILQLYFPCILLLSLSLLPTPVYTRIITAKTIHGLPNASPLLLTPLASLLPSRSRNVDVSEEEGGGREGAGVTSRKPETPTAESDADMDEDLLLELDFLGEGEEDDLGIPLLLNSLDSPPPGPNWTRDEEVDLMQLIEGSGLNYIIEDNPITTMEIMLNNQNNNNNRIEQGTDNNRGAASTVPSSVIHHPPTPSANASVGRIGAGAHADADSSGQTTSPHEQPPHLSPQNMSGTDLASDFQVSPPQLQQETSGFQGNVFSNRNPLSNSPVDFVMVGPSDVLPEAIPHHEQKLTCKGEECPGPSKRTADLEPDVLPTSTSTMLSHNAPDSTTGDDPASFLVPSGKSNDRRIPGVRGRRRKGNVKVTPSGTTDNNAARKNRNIVQQKGVITESGNLENDTSPTLPIPHSAESAQIFSSSPSPDLPSSSTQTSPPPIIEEEFTFESFMDLYGHGMGANMEIVPGNDNMKLPPFTEVKKRRLPRSVFQEHRDADGSTTYIVEGDSGGVMSGLNEIDIDTTGAGFPAKRQNVEKPERSAQADLNTFIPQLQNVDGDMKEEKQPLPAPAPPTLGETLLQKYLKGGLPAIGVTPKVPDPPLSLNRSTTTNSAMPSPSSTNIAQQIASSISAYVARSPTLKLQESLDNLIQPLAQDDSSIFKVPVPISRMGRQGGKLDQANSLHMMKRQAPYQTGGQQQSWTPQIVPYPQQRTMLNLNQISPQYMFQNYNAANQYPHHSNAAQSGQMAGAQWNTPNSDISKIPSYNNYQAQPVQQPQNVMPLREQRSSFNAPQPQYASPGTPIPSSNNYPGSPFSSAQQQQQLFRPQPQRSPVAQNLNQYSTAGSPMQSPYSPSSNQAPPLSPSGSRQQQMPIYGQPQSQMKQQMLESNMPMYVSQPSPAPPSSPSPMYPSPGNVPQQQPFFKRPGLTNSMNPQPGMMSYQSYGQQGPPQNGEENFQGANRIADNRRRYNLALQLQRQIAHQQLQLQQSQQQQYYDPRMRSQMVHDPNILSGMQQYNVIQQHRQAPTSYQPPPYNNALKASQGGQMNQMAWQGQVQMQNQNPNGMGGLISGRGTPMPGAGGQYLGRMTPHPGFSGLIPGRGTPMPGAVGGMPPDRTIVPGTGGFVADRRTPMPGMGTVYPDRRTPMPSPGFQYSPEVISGGEAALYRSRMEGVAQSRPFPAAAGSFGNNGWPGVDSQSSISNRDGAGNSIGQGVSNVKGYNNPGKDEQTIPVGNRGIHYSGGYAQPPAGTQLQSQQVPVKQNAETHGQVANAQPLGGPSQSHAHQNHHLPHHARSMPFYSQSDVDAHHSRVTGNNQTSKDIEFENESKALNWYLNEAKQKLHNNPVSTTTRPSSGLPPDSHGHHHPVTPTPAAPHSMNQGHHNANMHT